MKTVFTLRNLDGTYATHKYPDAVAYIYFVVGGLHEDTNDTLNISISEIDDGDYQLSLDEPEAAYEYIRIQISCNNCMDKRITLYPDKAYKAIVDAESTILQEGANSWTTAVIPTNTIDNINTAVSALQNTDLTGLATLENLTTAKEAIIAAIPTVGAIWGREAGDTTSRAITNAPDISDLATKNDLTDAVTDLSADITDAVTDLSGDITNAQTSITTDIIAEGTQSWATAGLARAEDIPEMISATDIATEVWNSAGRHSFINDILKKDVGNLEVAKDAYTLKHLIMASQKSKVLDMNGETHWLITDTRTDSDTNEDTIIANRTLALNDRGAITETFTPPPALNNEESITEPE